MINSFLSMSVIFSLTYLFVFIIDYFLIKFFIKKKNINIIIETIFIFVKFWQKAGIQVIFKFNLFF